MSLFQLNPNPYIIQPERMVIELIYLSVNLSAVHMFHGILGLVRGMELHVCKT